LSYESLPMLIAVSLTAFHVFKYLIK
jgi:hypothetical protein